jgi:outer membrane protein OmpA-like peptidoglycan-associated protein
MPCFAFLKKYAPVFFLFGAFSAFAQPLDDQSLDRLSTKADAEYERGDLFGALTHYEQALKENPREPYIIARIAVTAYRLRDYEQAQRRYVQLMSVDTQKEYPEAQFYYARCLKMNNFMDDARYHFELFIKKYTGKYTALRELAQNELAGIDAAKDAPRNENLKVRHGGDKINTPFSEYNPISAEGTTLYFSAVRSDTLFVKGKTKDLGYKNTSKIYKTTIKEGNFTDPQPLAGGINAPNEHTGNITLSADKNTMFFTRCQLANDILSHCDIFKTTRLSANEWRIGTILPALNAPEHTAKQPAIGKWDGKEGLFFVSDKKGGFGGWDIYFAAFLGENGYAEAQNLGANINTVGNEETPFFDQRTQTLFFSSDGLPTFGGYDVFMVKTAEPTNKTANQSTAENKISTPKRLGRGFNSLLDDLYFTLDAKGTRAFVTSNRTGSMGLHSQTCCDDIFMIDLPEGYFPTNSPNNTANLNILVNNDRYKPVQGATVEVVSATGEKTKLQTNSAGQITLLGLAAGSFLTIKASKNGFVSDSTTLLIATTDTAQISLLLTPTKASAPLVQTPKVPKITPPPVPVKMPALRSPSKNTAIALHNVYYEFARADLTDEAKATLDSIAQTLEAHPTLVVEIGSHTDSKGNLGVNKKLSDQRSYEALQYLVSSGIAADRLIPVGYGATKPVAPNEINGQDNEVGRALNRRTEFRILEGRALEE